MNNCNDNFLSSEFNKKYQQFYCSLAQNSKVDNLTNQGINWTMSKPIPAFIPSKEYYTGIDPEMIAMEMRAAGIYHNGVKIANI